MSLRSARCLASRSVRRNVETEAVIVRNTSSLVALGRDSATASAVTAATGLKPTSSTEAGEQPLRGSQRRYSTWHLTVESEPEDQSGFASMRALLLCILPAAPALRALEATHELRIDWAGFSDSSQGGFVL